MFISQKLGEDFSRGLIAENAPRAFIQEIGDSVKFVLRGGGQIGAFGEILANQAVGIFIAAPLPGAVRIGEIDLDAIGGSHVIGDRPRFINICVRKPPRADGRTLIVT